MQSSRVFGLTLIYCTRVLQASQLGVYRAFVDNYKVAVETVRRCQANSLQFADLSKVWNHATCSESFDDRAVSSSPS